MNEDSSKKSFALPFSSPHPDLQWEAEASEGAIQPPETERPPPRADHPPPDSAINKANVSASADPLPQNIGSNGSDNDDEDDKFPLASLCVDDSDNESPGKVASRKPETVLVAHQASPCPLNQLTIEIDEFSHQRLILYGFKVDKFGISIKADLSDGHPISKTILLAHAKKYITPSGQACHRA